jgi:riboflavin synthase
VFTGIVEATGRVVACEPQPTGLRVVVDGGGLDLRDVAVGDSIAVAGCCLTVVRMDAPALEFDVSDETLRCTTGFPAGRRVNLEKALRLADRLGGHLMSGHVDGVARVTAFHAQGADAGHRRLEIEAPKALARYVAVKGSVGVDGVSLTTNALAGERFVVNLIPHTLAVTTLGDLEEDDFVNLEVDLLARYVERLHAHGRDGG